MADPSDRDLRAADEALLAIEPLWLEVREDDESHMQQRCLGNNLALRAALRLLKPAVARAIAAAREEAGEGTRLLDWFDVFAREAHTVGDGAHWCISMIGREGNFNGDGLADAIRAAMRQEER